MKLMLTSFGIEQSIAGESDVDSMFRGMPPVSFRQVSSPFMPDYELLLLCDKVLMDGESFGQLVGSPFSAYTHVADTFRALRSEGRIELVDFVSIVRRNAGLLDRMLEHDIRILDQWIDPLRESLMMWRGFADASWDVIRHMAEEDYRRRDSEQGEGDLFLGIHAWHAFHEPSHRLVPEYQVNRDLHRAAGEVERVTDFVNMALHSARKRRLKEYRGALRDVVRSYLAHVNSNLILSNELNVGFHDWLDFTPFYAVKFLSVGRTEDRAHESQKHLEKLFNISFPNLAIRDAKSLLRALNDKRIQDLRQLVDDAVNGRVKFDEGFAQSVLNEVLHAEKSARKARSVLGYVTMPVGFIPWIGTAAQKLLDEAVGTPLERKLKSQNRWFYMLSDIAESRPSEAWPQDQTEE
ncbi:MAG: hypothetical protein JW818_20220 [Pirellulales bacterium]|nr:hypothetical protein [Pirellulales bacterium]